MAKLDAEDGSIVGFDGSQMNDRPELAEALTKELQQEAKNEK